MNSVNTSSTKAPLRFMAIKLTWNPYSAWLFSSETRAELTHTGIRQRATVKLWFRWVRIRKQEPGRELDVFKGIMMNGRGSHTGSHWVVRREDFNGQSNTESLRWSMDWGSRWNQRMVESQGNGKGARQMRGGSQNARLTHLNLRCSVICW